MIIALIDNGSLEPAAHRHLRAVAAAVSSQTGTTVHAVSWKHSDRIAPELIDHQQAWTLAPFIRAMVALGQRDFVFIPFFVSAQGAIGSALRRDLEGLRQHLGFEFTFTDGLAARGTVAPMVADQVRAALGSRYSATPAPVIVVDHGGPSASSASVRDEIAAAVRMELGSDIGALAAVSMEGAHPPLLAGQLRARGFAGEEVVVAPLFLTPGRHAGPDGDVARICASSGTTCHLAERLGEHPSVVDALASALRDTLSTLHAHPFA